jgi:hypothetical protein
VRIRFAFCILALVYAELGTAHGKEHRGAHRQAHGENQGARRQAQLLFKRGTERLTATDYQAAVDDYLEAYRLFPDPRMHFNIAHAYRLAGDKPHAIEHYQKFIAALVAGPDVDEARRYVVTLIREVELERARTPSSEPPSQPTPPAAAAAAPPAPIPPTEPVLTPAAATPPAAASQAVAVTSPPPRTEPPPRRRWPIWVGVAVGVVVAAGAATTAALLLTQRSEPVFKGDLR